MVGTIPSYLGQPRLLSAAAPGTGLTTTRAHIAIPPGTKYIKLAPNTFSTAIVAKFALNPYLRILKTADAMATDPVDYSEAAQDGVAATVVDLSSMDTLANGDALYIGAAEPFSGLQVDSLAADGGAGVLTGVYWNGAAWADISLTDNTSGFGSDGTIVWTVPTAWARTQLATALALPVPRKGTTGAELYWIRLVTSVAYDASTTASSIYAINRYGDATPGLIAGDTFTTAIDRKFNGGNLQALTDAGTANLLVTGYY